jgi:NlpC/P60 family putative phage cell wall peptidase
MAFTRDDVIAEARSWIGTPWHHQASVKGVGCDCIGLIRGVLEPFVGRIEVPLDYSPTWHLYRSEPRLYQGFKAVADAINLTQALPGDILLFGAGKGPAHHCAFLTSEGGLIHSYQEVGQVVEQGVSLFWRPKLMHAFGLHRTCQRQSMVIPGKS